MFSIKGFSNNDLEITKKFFKYREILRNQVVYEEGKPAQSMFFVDTGSIKLVERKAFDGKDDTLFAIVKPGGHFGEEAVLADNSLYQHSAIALENCALYEFSRDSLQEIMVEAISTGTKLLLGVSKNYREAVVTPVNAGKLMVFYSPIGGVGTTELAVNTAIQLAAAGKRVGFLDADFEFGDAGIYLGGGSSPNIARLIQMEEILVFDRIKYYFQNVCGVSLLAPPALPQEAELVSRAHLNQVILEMGKKFDFVIVDCPSSIQEATLFLWDNAEIIALVGNPDFRSMTAYHRLMKVLSRLDYPADKLLMLMNRCRPENESLLEEFKKFSTCKMVAIPTLGDLSRQAHVAGKPFSLSHPKEPASLALDRLVKSLLGSEETHVARGGIFSRLKSIFG